MLLFPFNFFARNSLPCDGQCCFVVAFYFPVAEIDGSTYWRHPFNSLFHPKQLEEFIIMDINRVQEKKKVAGAGARSNKVRVPLDWIPWFGPSPPSPAQLSFCFQSFCLAKSHFCILPLAKLFSGSCWFGSRTGMIWIPLSEMLFC